jgi:hypothetical protein
MEEAHGACKTSFISALVWPVCRAFAPLAVLALDLVKTMV